VRVAAAGLAAIVAALVLLVDSAARAGDTSPFPSPSPSVAQIPGSGGYALIGVGVLTGTGGTIAGPMPSPSSTPQLLPFSSAHASQYSLEVAGRLSSSYVAALDYDDANVHGDDSPIVSRFNAAILYNFNGGQTALGIAYGAVQRSTLATSANGFGVGAAILPDFARKASPYASFYYYPSLGVAGSRASFTVARFGIALAANAQSGIFERAGFYAQHFGVSAVSPNTLTGFELGVGTTF